MPHSDFSVRDDSGLFASMETQKKSKPSQASSANAKSRSKVEVREESHAQSLVTPPLKKLKDRIIATVLTRRSSIPIKYIHIDASTEPDEGWDEIVINVVVEAPPRQALALWGAICKGVEKCAQHLPQNEKDSLYEKIAINVLW